MTDTSEQTLFAANNGSTQADRVPSSDSNSAGSAPTEGATRPTKRRGGSLSSMLLPELQELASSLGIPTTRVRKSDLVTAIQSAQSGRSAERNAPLAAVEPGAQTDTSAG